MALSRSELSRIQSELSLYIQQVNSSKLTILTKRTYQLHAENFVKWLNGEFTPGGTLEGK